MVTPLFGGILDNSVVLLAHLRLFSMKLGLGVLWGSASEVGVSSILVTVIWSKSREAPGGSG